MLETIAFILNNAGWQEKLSFMRNLRGEEEMIMHFHSKATIKAFERCILD